MGYFCGILVVCLLTFVCRIYISANVCRYIQPSQSLGFDIVDLTHTIGPETVILPFNLPYNFTTITSGVSEQFKHWVEAYYLGMPEHINTHVDALAHMYRHRPHMHEVPMRNMVGPGVIVDVKQKAMLNNTYGLCKKDLLEWEYYYGRIPDGAVVIVNSGWYRRYPNKKAVFNTNTPDNPLSYRYPSLTLEAVDWLLNNRRVIAVGIDTPTVDFFFGQSLPVHRRLFKDCVIAL